MTPPHLPTVYLSRMAARHPGCWAAVDTMRAGRGRELPDWPAWCFLPLAGSYAILAGGRPLDPERAGEIAAFAALAAWRVTQGIYEIHPAVRAAVESTPLEGELPVDVLYRLPEWCPYVRTPGLRVGPWEPHGFWAYLEADANHGHAELRIALDCEPTIQALLPIYLGGTLAEGVAAAEREARAQLARLGTPAFPVPSASEFAEVVRPLVALVLYLCAENAEVRDPAGRRERPENPRPQRTKGGLRLFPPPAPTTWEVGYRTGAALEAAGARDEEQGGTHASPRAHVRRAHWHHYWTGPRSGEQVAVIRWVAPTLIGGEGIVPTVRPVG